MNADSEKTNTQGERLPSAGEAKLGRFARKSNRRLTPEELGSLAAKFAEERDPAKARALKKQIMAGFYGDERANKA